MADIANLHITDPMEPALDPARAATALALRFIHDGRDIPFLKLMALQTATVVPFAVYLFVTRQFPLWLAIPYWLLTFAVFLGPYTLMLHNVSHRRLFKHPYGFLNHYVPLVLGPFFGQTPGTYYAHHLGMHHPENNLLDDLSTTMPFQRDSFIDFLRYFGRFVTIGALELAGYFGKKRRPKLSRQVILGELSWLALAVVATWVSWRAAIVVFVIPIVLIRFLMLAGNWGQHAFIDAEAPENCYRNSITCINAGYNRRCFNDGYHIGHHVKASRHWTEMPSDFLRNRKKYAEERAIVFRGIDFFIVWLFLMLKRYDWLARCYVPLDERAWTKSEIIELLRTRTRRIPAAA